MYNFNELLIGMMMINDEVRDYFQHCIAIHETTQVTEDIYEGTMDNDEVRDEYTGERWYQCPHTGELTEAIYME